MTRWLVVLGALSLIALAGCSNGGTDCQAAAGNAVALARASLETEATTGDDKDRKNKEAMLPALKEEFVKHCKSEKWSDALRKCIATAQSPGALEACDPDKAGGETADQASEKPALDEAEPSSD